MGMRILNMIAAITKRNIGKYMLYLVTSPATSFKATIIRSQLKRTRRYQLQLWKSRHTTFLQVVCLGVIRRSTDSEQTLRQSHVVLKRRTRTDGGRQYLSFLRHRSYCRWCSDSILNQAGYFCWLYLGALFLGYYVPWQSGARWGVGSLWRRSGSWQAWSCLLAFTRRPL